jgi:hypothetical protein
MSHLSFLLPCIPERRDYFNPLPHDQEIEQFCLQTDKSKYKLHFGNFIISIIFVQDDREQPLSVE